MIAYGKNVFNELRSNLKQIRKIYLSKNFNDQQVLNTIKQNKIKYIVTDNKTLDHMAQGNHQGIVIVIDDYDYYDYQALLEEKIIVMLDHIEDPHNLGAIIRTCEAAGVKSIIIPKDRSAVVNETVMKTSSGALNYVKVAQVSNLVQTIEALKKAGYFVYAADMSGINYKKVDFSEKCVLIVGSEGKGVSRLVKEASDLTVAIPMNGQVNSLNVSVALAVLIYGVVNR